jgi:hypothetical protein
MTQEDARLAQALGTLIKPMLQGHGPAVQGAILADMVSLWIAGHNPDIRAEVWANWATLVHRLVPASEQELFGNLGFPRHRQ